MHYVFDDFGRFSGTSDIQTDRSTAIEPPVPDETANWNGHDWVVVAGIIGAPVTAIEPPAPMPINQPKTVSPVEFKLLFTALERITIKNARSTDPVIDDFFEIVEDPRLTHVNMGLQSTQDALAYLESKGLITAERRTQILSGQVQ